MKNIIFSLAMLALPFWSTGQLNMELLGHFQYTEELSDVWGYVDEAGNEYALVGVYNGLSVVDVTDPENPVEIYFSPGPESIWRDIKTWGDYAYVSNESGNGIFIVDLGPLPGGTIVNTTTFTGSSFPFQSSHNLYIDEFGKLYIFGSDNGNGGAIICDLTQDPMNPVELGRFNDYYLHDGMARGDTLWGAAIYEGVLSAIDVADPSNTQVMGTVSTPSQFAHNAWVSDDGSHVFTTDEVNSGYIGAFNVTDLGNMFETDRIRSSSGTDVIPHNVHVNNDFLVTSYYTDGIVVHDAKYPDKLVEVGNFDTSPSFSGSGYNGSWGTYPFLPSGNILASDIEEGLYILGIDYIRAAYLEGVVTDENTGDPLFNVQVEILGTDLSTQTAFDGSYEIGTTISGTFDILFSKAGYTPKTITGVNLVNGEIAILDTELGNFVVGLPEENQSEKKINLYPNPFKSKFTLEYDFSGIAEGNLMVAVYNSAGMMIERFNPGSLKGTLTLGEHLGHGLYLIRFEANGEALGIKRVIKR